MEGQMPDMKGLQEELRDVKENRKLPSYKTFRALMLDRDPDMTEEDIKKAYELTKKILK